MRAPLVGALLLAVALAAVVASARPGGGQSYSGSSPSGSSSGGSSGGYSGSSSSGSSSGYSSGSSYRSSSGEAPPFIVYPFLGFVVIVILALLGETFMTGLDKIADASDRFREWTSGPPAKTEPVRSVDEGPPQDPWQIVRAVDADFSASLFEDFAQALYVAVNLARTRPEAAAELAAYVRPRAWSQLAGRETPGSVESVVVGKVRVLRVIGVENIHRAIVDIESNVTYATPGHEQTEFLVETWVFERQQSARTRPWTGVRTFGCPSCGAPLSSSATATCASCGVVQEARAFDWGVGGISLKERKKTAREAGRTVEEKGTDSPTVHQPGLAAALAQMTADDPAFTLPALEARVGEVFGALHEGWAAQELRIVRPYVTDGLLRSLQADVADLRNRGLVNAVEGARITRQELARLVRDRQFDAATVRVWATGYEVTTRNGEVVEGSRTSERPYSEYWTLVRGTGVRGAPPAARACPSCAAPLSINMAGSCDHCGAHVTSGEFDWVLSRIEQDDAYEA